ncbi:WSC domain-containing protein [Coprinopsis sp. MPI-PUGE-AT-0042]|nr:WSC domain-containing protein [Coprinopsis sp. MPI-PUGE-AT-0042]
MPSLLQSLVFALSLTFASLVNAIPSSLEARQAPSIKTTVGTWTYKGCYYDFGPRILTFRFDIPAGNNAVRCTNLCAANGYGLAGMEYGTECWCDNYMPYGQLRPNSECSFTCPGDSTEYCGAGNRMILYQNTAGTPPSTSSCINWRDVNGFSFGNNILEAVPKTGGGSVTRLYAIPTNPFTDPIYYTIISTCPPGCVYGDYYNFPLIDNALLSYNSRPIYVNAGDSPSFIFKWPQNYVSYTGYCAKPTTLSSSPYIGKPLLSLNGDVASWALCTNTTTEANGRQDIVWQPRINHPHYVKSACTDVWIQIAPYSGNI